MPDELTKTNDVRIVDVKIPFDSLVTLIVKLVLAAIPAGLVLAVVAFLGAALLKRMIG